MHAHPESYFPGDYRQGRQAFIAAAQARGIDVIGRVHPTARGPDEKPLFIDTAALGPRSAARALLLLSGTNGMEGCFGSGVQTGLLREGLAPPEGARIVLVHALDPYGFAWDRPPDTDASDSAYPGWSLAMLEAVMTEDLRYARKLVAIDLRAGSSEPEGEVCAVSAALERMLASRHGCETVAFTMLKTGPLLAPRSPDNPAWRRRAYRLSRDAVRAALATL